MRVEVAGGEATACRCSVEADAVMGAGRRISLVAGTELGRAAGVAVPLDWISPAADETLFVNDEIAQPVHDAASLGWGVLIRGADESTVLGGGRTESGIVEENFRIL